MADIEVVLGDITHEPVDVIVNAANSSLRGGGGVDGAIHRAAGPRLAEAGGALAPCPPGEAVATSAFDLDPPVRYVIHTVGPRWAGGGTGEAETLRSCYRRCLEVADELGARSIAFPAIATGVYGFPSVQAAAVAVATLHATPTRVERIRLVAFDQVTHGHLRAAVAARPDDGGAEDGGAEDGGAEDSAGEDGAGDDRAGEDRAGTVEDGAVGDDALVAVLDRAQVDAWHELCALADEEPDFTTDVEWTQPAPQPDGTWIVGYVTYHGRLSRATRLLSFVGAVTPAYRWMDSPVPEPGPDGLLSTADAIRAATALVRGERFCDGTVAEAAENGLLRSVLRSLAASYRAGTAGPVNGS